RGGVEREFAAESVLRASAVALADLGGATNERVEPAVRTSHDLRAAHGGGAATWHADRSVRSIDGTATSAGLKCTNLGGAGRHPRHESAQTDVAHGGDDRLREARGHVQAEVRAFTLLGTEIVDAVTDTGRAVSVVRPRRRRLSRTAQRSVTIKKTNARAKADQMTCPQRRAWRRVANQGRSESDARLSCAAVQLEGQGQSGIATAAPGRSASAAPAFAGTLGSRG